MLYKMILLKKTLLTLRKHKQNYEPNDDHCKFSYFCRIAFYLKRQHNYTKYLPQGIAK